MIINDKAMRRRSFIKGMAAAGASSLIPAGFAGAALAGCSSPKPSAPGDFNEVLDRSGTWSIKYGRATDGEIPMWIADMDFRTDPYVSEALRKRLERDALGYTRTPPEFIESVIAAYRDDRTWLNSLKRYIEGNIFRVEKFVATNDLGIKSIKKAKVIPSNGLSYGPGGEGFIRLNLGCPVSVLDEALQRIEKAFRR